MRICRIASYPTEDSPGTGLPGYHLSRAIRVPTLLLTRKTGKPLDVPGHVELRSIPYHSPAFGERIDPLTAAAKAAGLLRFFLASLPSMIRFKPDIVHIHSPLYLHHALFARFVLRAKTCMTFHGSDLLRIMTSRPAKRLLPKIIDVFFYVSESMRDDLASFIPADRIVHTPNGVDPRRFCDLGMPREKRIAAVGNLRWQKGYDYLIEAFSKIEAHGYTLFIYGEGSLRGELQDRIEEAGLDEKAVLAGRKNHAELLEALNRSEIYVMSSVSEGFPKALLEAMACGLPVVATDAGCCREVIRECGICVEPANPDELARALETLINSESMKRDFSRKAKETARRYGWDTSCHAVERTYTRLLHTATNIETELPALDAQHRDISL